VGRVFAAWCMSCNKIKKLRSLILPLRKMTSNGFLKRQLPLLSILGSDDEHCAMSTNPQYRLKPQHCSWSMSIWNVGSPRVSV